MEEEEHTAENPTKEVRYYIPSELVDQALTELVQRYAIIDPREKVLWVDLGLPVNKDDTYSFDAVVMDT